MQQGESLGPYEIVRPLGAGGMGEVYLARDTRLGREVAIKVLPAAFATDAERLARFEQEARAAAALNHPNIAAVHDVGVGEDAEGAPVHFLVQEYLTGSTLEEALEKPWQLPRILATATEIAEGLAVAHAAGIVHRDLKPANIFLTEQGHAKILDFGLAKLTEPSGPTVAPDSAQTALDRSPTILGTVAGQIMGTAGYMAPEQIDGGAIDGRTDLFAFGCLLYEALAGRRPFSGRSLLQTLDLVLHEEAAPLEVRADRPPELRRIVDKCMAKDPDLRYQTARDLVVDLKRLAADVAAGRVAAPPVATSVASSASIRRGVAPWIAGALVLVAAVAGAAASSWFGNEETPTAIQRFSTSLPEGVIFTSTGRPVVAISPDGTRVAVSADDQVWVRDLAWDEFRRLRGTEGGGRAPVLSPDGREVVFWRDDELLRVGFEGGVPVTVTAAENPWGLRWQSDGTLLYGQGPAGIFRVAAAGGQPERLYTTGEDEYAHGPQLLDGGRWLLMTLSDQFGGWDEGRVVAYSLESGEMRDLVTKARDGRALPGGILVYARGSTLLAQSFDERELTVLGAPVPVLEAVMAASNLTGTSQLSVSDNGTAIYATSSDNRLAQPHQLVWRDAAGEIELTPVPAQEMRFMSMSPDRTRVALATPVADSTVSGRGFVALNRMDAFHVYDLRTGAGQRIGGDLRGASPIWGPDGRWIYVGAVDGRGYDIFRIPADDSGPPEPVVVGEEMLAPLAVAPDGSFLIVRRDNETRNDPDILRYWVEEERLEDLVATDAVEGQARLSPDGRYLAYTTGTSTTSGVTSQVLVLDLETGARFPVSRTADHRADIARWSPSGDRIYYLALHEARQELLMAVDVDTAAGFVASPAFEVFPMDLINTSTFGYEIVGERFLFPATVDLDTLRNAGDPRERLVFVTGWFEELRARLAAR